MNFLHRFDFILASLLSFGISFSGYGQSSSARLTHNLAPVDKVELFKLKKRGDVWTGEFVAEKTVEGKEAEKAAQLWRKQSFVSYSPSCHNPGYAIKFYNRDKLLVYATLCWDCDNIEFLTPKLEKRVGFKGRGIKGREFLKYLENTLADGRKPSP
jgi:hypothetical protein